MRVSSSWLRRCRPCHTWLCWMSPAMVSLSRVWTAWQRCWKHLRPRHFRSLHITGCDWVVSTLWSYRWLRRRWFWTAWFWSWNAVFFFLVLWSFCSFTLGSVDLKLIANICRAFYCNSVIGHDASLHPALACVLPLWHCVEWFFFLYFPEMKFVFVFLSFLCLYCLSSLFLTFFWISCLLSWDV